jgi:YaiO family outer membrane protein
MYSKISICILYISALLFCSKSTLAQSPANTEDLFKSARTACFDKKDYVAAIELSKQALALSPNYADIQIFMARIYAWSDQYDSARKILAAVVQKKPAYIDAWSAAADVELWSDQYPTALDLCNKGLQYEPGNRDLLLKKAKVLKSLQRYQEAASIAKQLLKTNAGNDEARAFANRLKDELYKNKIGVTYDYTYFDKQFSDPWHIVSVDYTRQTSIGSLTGRINYANRFKQSGVQFEAEAYPHISNTFYSYVSAGYSNDVGVFPKYRGGFSLYANLPRSFEAEAGVRYLYFSNSTWIYTAYLGKYYKNWLFGARTYLTPGSSSISQSYSLSARYYYTGDADSYVALSAGSGISPDDRTTSSQLNSTYKLLSKKASASWKFAVNRFNLFSLNAGLINQEYKKDSKGNQLELGVGYARRF